MRTYDVCLVDLQEVFARIANPSKLAAGHGLVAGNPCEGDAGWDLMTDGGIERWEKCITLAILALSGIGSACTSIGVCEVDEQS